MKINLQISDKQIFSGIDEIASILDIELSEDGTGIKTEKINEGLVAGYSASEGFIGYQRKCDFFRALGLFVENVKKGEDFHITEKASFSTLGTMFDCSRNGVMTVGSAKKMIRHMALMGFNTLMLYTEDTFEVKEYPYFGYMRGRYSADEIKEIDEYADMFGIELMPCIQTLAHMYSALRWPVFSDITDIGDIMLADYEKTYEVLDAMFASLAGMFSSRRINIGMDEAHLLGRGQYLDKFGYKKRSDIMISHLKKVVEICNKYGFKPMMWSDMFFRMLHGDSYIGTTTDIPAEIVDNVPKEVTLIHWDYYSENIEAYDNMLDKHLKFNNDIMFAGGAWKWIGFAPGNQYSFKTTKLALESCKQKKISQVIVTAWGDDGAECALFSILPVLQLYAESCYTENMDTPHVAERFKICVNADLDAFMQLDIPNLVPGNEAPGGRYINPSKNLFYQDILTGLYDKHVKIGEYNSHYRLSKENLGKLAEQNPQWSYIFENLANFCNVLEIKSDLGVRLKDAYDRKDKTELRKIMDSDLAELHDRIEIFYGFFYKQWKTENKIFGFEVQDMRIGGLLRRVETTVVRINEYLSGEIDKIDELEQERLYFDCRTSEDLPRIIPAYGYRSIITVGNQ
ncbi:MAG: family 20 glycosylhydrolase [Saccharofermentanales bacterium]